MNVNDVLHSPVCLGYNVAIFTIGTRALRNALGLSEMLHIRAKAILVKLY